MDLASRASRLIFPPISALTSCEIDMSFLAPTQAEFVEPADDEDQGVAEQLKEKLSKSKDNLVLNQALAEVEKHAMMKKAGSLRASDSIQPMVNQLDVLAAPFNSPVHLNKRMAAEVLEDILEGVLDSVENDVPLLLENIQATLATMKKKPYKAIRGFRKRVWNRFLFCRSFRFLMPKKGVLKLAGLWQLYRASWLEVVTHGCRLDRVVVRKVGWRSYKIECLQKIERKMFSKSFRGKVKRLVKFHVSMALSDLSTFAGATSTVWQSALWKLVLHQLSTLPYVISRAAWEEQGAFSTYLDVVQANFSEEGKKKLAERGSSAGVHEQLKAAVERSEILLSGPPFLSRKSCDEVTGMIAEASAVRIRLDKESEALQRACWKAGVNLEQMVQKRTLTCDKMWQEYLKKPGDFEFDLPVADLYEWVEMKERHCIPSVMTPVLAESTSSEPAGMGVRQTRLERERREMEQQLESERLEMERLEKKRRERERRERERREKEATS